MMTDKRRRQCKIKCRAAVPVVFRPQAPAVSLDDGPADGKTHAKSVPFGGVERLKNFVDLVAL